MIQISDSSSNCVGGHYFIFVGDPPDSRLPDGWTCQCGAIKYSRRQAILDEIDVLKRELDKYI